MEEVKAAILADIAKRSKDKEDKPILGEITALEQAERLKATEVTNASTFIDFLEASGYEIIDLKEDPRSEKRKLFIRKAALPQDAIIYTRKGFVHPYKDMGRNVILFLFTKDREFTPKAYWDEMVAQRKAKYGKDWEVTETLAEKKTRRAHDREVRIIKQKLKDKRAIEREIKDIEKEQAALELEG